MCGDRPHRVPPSRPRDPSMQAVASPLRAQPFAAGPLRRPAARAAALRVQASSSPQSEGLRERAAKAACVAAAALSLFAGGAPPPPPPARHAARRRPHRCLMLGAPDSAGARSQARRHGWRA